MKLKAYTERIHQITVPFGDETLNLSYFPNHVKLTDLLEPEQATPLQLADNLSMMIAAWDLEDEGTPVATTAEALAALPVTFLVGVQRAINEDMKPGEATGSN